MKQYDANRKYYLISGTGAYACQIAKNVFKPGKVITTVSTAKIPNVEEFLGEGVVDESKISFPKMW